MDLNVAVSGNLEFATPEGNYSCSASITPETSTLWYQFQTDEERCVQAVVESDGFVSATVFAGEQCGYDLTCVADAYYAPGESVAFTVFPGETYSIALGAFDEAAAFNLTLVVRESTIVHH